VSRRSFRILVPLLAAALVVGACGPTTPSVTGAPSAAATSGPISPAPGGPAEIQVYAAASLEHVLVELARAYEAGHPGTTITATTGSSAALAGSIEEGAPADILLSADTAIPQRLADAGRTTGDVTIFAGNELALIVPAGNPAMVLAPRDMANTDVKVVAAAEDAPITAYTRQLLDQLAGLQTYPDDIAARYESNVVSREDDVRGIVAKVTRGEGDAGIVYLTDAKASKDTQTIAIPSEFNVAARYGAVALKGSANDEAAAGFLAWLTSTEAQDILASFGFRPVA